MPPKITTYSQGLRSSAPSKSISSMDYSSTSPTYVLDFGGYRPVKFAVSNYHFPCLYQMLPLENKASDILAGAIGSIWTPNGYLSDIQSSNLGSYNGQPYCDVNGKFTDIDPNGNPVMLHPDYSAEDANNPFGLCRGYLINQLFPSENAYSTLYLMYHFNVKRELTTVPTDNGGSVSFYRYFKELRRFFYDSDGNVQYPEECVTNCGSCESCTKGVLMAHIQTNENTDGIMLSQGLSLRNRFFQGRRSYRYRVSASSVSQLPEDVQAHGYKARNTLLSALALSNQALIQGANPVPKLVCAHGAIVSAHVAVWTESYLDITYAADITVQMEEVCGKPQIKVCGDISSGHMRLCARHSKQYNLGDEREVETRLANPLPKDSAPKKKKKIYVDYSSEEDNCGNYYTKGDCGKKSCKKKTSSSSVDCCCPSQPPSDSSDCSQLKPDFFGMPTTIKMSFQTSYVGNTLMLKVYTSEYKEQTLLGSALARGIHAIQAYGVDDWRVKPRNNSVILVAGNPVIGFETPIPALSKVSLTVMVGISEAL